jgi:hypothetical protein
MTIRRKAEKKRSGRKWSSIGSFVASYAYPNDSAVTGDVKSVPGRSESRYDVKTIEMWSTRVAKASARLVPIDEIS